MIELQRVEDVFTRNFIHFKFSRMMPHYEILRIDLQIHLKGKFPNQSRSYVESAQFAICITTTYVTFVRTHLVLNLHLGNTKVRPL